MFNTVTIHQPVFFPYMGTIAKIIECDYFIFLDDVQFDDGGFQNRNRILTKDGIRWITVPLKSPRYMRDLREIEISYNKNWQIALLQMLQCTYGKCTYFTGVYNLVEEILSNNYKYLVDLNIDSTIAILDYLKVKKKVYKSSDFINKPPDKTDRIIYLVKAVEGNCFISGDKAKDYLEIEKFGDIKVCFQNYKCKEYQQKWSDKFVPLMSIIDYVMYMGSDKSGL